MTATKRRWRADRAALDKMRTYRPRILVHGASGMGQAWLGPAILHHLEGFHVQTLDLGTLMGDSSRVSSLIPLDSRDSLNSADGRGSSCPALCRGQAASALGHLHPFPITMGFRHFRHRAKYHTSSARRCTLERPDSSARLGGWRTARPTIRDQSMVRSRPGQPSQA